jgi:hypothetical protein
MRRLIVLLLIVLGAAAVNGQKVKVGADPNVDISKYKTYSWDVGTIAPNPLISQLIIDSVDQAMKTKGLTKVDAKPDVTLAVWAAMGGDMQISYPSWSGAMGSAASTGIAVSSQSWVVTKGTIVVDINDAGTKSTVWRGSAISTLPHGPTGDKAKDAKDAAKHIRKAVEKMFKQYPRPGK